MARPGDAVRVRGRRVEPRLRAQQVAPAEHRRARPRRRARRSRPSPRRRRRGTAASGTRPTCANGVSSTSQLGRAQQRADELPEERDGDEPVGDAGAGAGHERVGERGDAEEQQRGRQAVGAGLEHARRARCSRPASAAPAHVSSPAAARSRRRRRPRAASRPPSQPARGRPAARAASRAARSDSSWRAAPICAQANRLTASTKKMNTNDEVAGRRHDRARAELGDLAARCSPRCRRRRCSWRPRRGRARTRRRRSPRRSGWRARRAAPARSARRAARSGAARCRAREAAPVPMSRRAADPRGERRAAARVAATGSEQHERLRAGEGPQLLGPAERRRPAQPAGAAGGVGDHAREQRTAPTIAPPSSSATRRVGASWLASAPTPDEDGHDRRGREGQVGRSAGGQAGGEEADQPRQPQHDRARADRGHRREERRAPRRPCRRARARRGRCPPRRAAPARRRARRTRRRRSRASRRRARRL